MKLTGADITIKLLERQGINKIAGIPGGANLPLYDALSKSEMIRHILARHEQGAGFIGQGQARATGKASVFFATSGPGATNAVTSMADARLDSIPLICITGQVPQELIGTDAFQEIDTYGLSVPISKHNYFVRSARELLEIIPDAFRVALSGRPGPVWIDIPKDVQNELIQFDAYPPIGSADSTPDADVRLIKEAADYINEAKRPVAYIGGGAINSEAGEEIRQLIENASIPAAMTLMGLGTIPSEHERSIGMLGMHAARHTNHILEECDLLIALGARFDDRATGKVAQFCPDAKIVHIDIDAAELGKIKNPHVGIVADLKKTLKRLLPNIDVRSNESWLDRVEVLKSEYSSEFPRRDEILSPYGIIREVAERLGDAAIVTTDVGQHQMRVAQSYPFRRPRQLQTSGGLGTMGFGLPAAIGAAIEEPEKTIVCFSGDGSILMNIQELATAVEENANVKIILSNNNSLGLVHQQQDLFYGKRMFASSFSSMIDFAAIARGFGMKAFDLGDAGDPESMLDDALSGAGPALINVPINLDQHVFPMVPPGGANKEMLHA